MYDKNGNLIDRREMLKVKVKHLAAEARIIRREEQKTHGYLRESLHLHRVYTVRKAARSAHIAYALVKGRTYEQLEKNPSTEPDWDDINRMIKTYGPKEAPLVNLKVAA